MIFLRRVAAFALVAVLGPAQPSQTTEPAPIRTQSNEVLLDLVVRDKRGRLIRDLQAADIEILDGGKAVEIRSLRLSADAGAASAMPPVAGDPMRDVKFTTLVFESMSREAAVLARPAAIEFINRAVGTRSLIGVFLIRRALRVISPYSTDKAALKKAVEVATGGAREQPDSVATQVENLMKTSVGNSQQLAQVMRGDLSSLGGNSVRDQPPTSGEIAGIIEAQRLRIALNMLQASQTIEMEAAGRPSLQGLRAAIEVLRKLPGRKTLIYLTEQFQIPPSIQPQFQALIAAANTANVSVYCVDANGLIASERTRASADKLRAAVAASMETVTAATDDVKRSQVMAFDTAEESLRTGNFSALQELAASTGGTLLADSNDFTGPMARVAEDIATHYEVTYAPEIERYDGKFRPVSVNVKRKGLRVQSRKGYFALPPGVGMNVAPHEIPLLKAIDDHPIDFPYQYSLFQMGRAPDDSGRISGEAVIEVPMGAVELEEDPGAKLFRLKLAFLVQFRNQAGEAVYKLSRDLVQAGPLNQIGRAKTGTFVWTQSFEVPPGEYTVHFAVMDRLSEKLSTGHKAWRTSTEPLSDLVLVKRVEQAQSKSWLQMDQMRVVPSLDEHVEASAGALSVFFRVQPQGAAATAVELIVKRDGVEQARSPLPVTAEPGKEFPYVATIATAGLPSGQYELEVAVKQGERVSTRRLPLRIAGADPVIRTHQDATSGLAERAESDETPHHLSIQQLELQPGMLALPAEEQLRIVQSVRASARDYLKSLPNFFCVQFTRRLQNPKGDGKFEALDRFQEVLSFIDGKEDYQSLQLSWPPPPDDGSRGRGVSSRGEWGGLMGAIFDPEAAANFTWMSTGLAGNDRVHVFDYAVDAKHSQFSLTWGDRWKGKLYPKLKPAYHGTVVVDAETLRVRRLTLEAKVGLGEFPIEETTHEVDYEVQQLGGTEYMLPRRAVMQARLGKRKLIRNEIDFRDFRKWGAGSEMKVP